MKIYSTGFSGCSVAVEEEHSIDSLDDEDKDSRNVLTLVFVCVGVEVPAHR